MPLVGRETVMFSDSQRLFWSKRAPGVIRASRTHPSALTEHGPGSPSSPLFSPSEKQRVNCVTGVRVDSGRDSPGGGTAWGCWGLPVKHTAGKIRHRKLGEKGEVGWIPVLLRVAFCVSEFRSWLLSPRLKAELKNMQKQYERLGWDDNREATWPVRGW